MDDRLAATRADFVDLVRDALLHLYDLTALQTHPLATLVARQGPEAPARGQGLRRTLLDAIRELHPGVGIPTTSRAWRTYRLLELRYIEGLDVTAVSDQLALGRSHYHREHHRALEAVADSLWEQTRGRTERAANVSSRGLAARESATIAHEPLDLATTVTDICDLLEPLCAQREIVLVRSIPTVPMAIHSDRVALRQALLTIAARVIESGKRGAVTVALAARDGWAHVSVGRPLTADGLAIPLTVDDAAPFVTTVRGRLGHLPDADQPDVRGVRLSVPIGSGPKLLVVDNSLDFVRLVERTLSGSGWEVIGAGDVEGALRAVAEHQPRAILLDIVLPGQDGWELLQALKREPLTEPIPVIICSVLGQPSVAIALGAAAYLQKPIDGPQLMAALGPYVDAGVGVDEALK